MSVNQDTNVAKARAAWGPGIPAWVLMLATACDRSNQRAVAERLDKSSGYVSRLLSRKYTGDYAEASKLIAAAYSPDRVECPAFNVSIALRTCIRERRRKGPARDFRQRLYDAHCPDCPNNTDDQAEEE